MVKSSMEENVSRTTDMLNNFSFDYDKFCNLMDRQHKTLQQNFTKLCFAWIHHCARNEYLTDDRNQASHDVCAALLNAAEKEGMDEYSFALPLI